MRERLQKWPRARSWGTRALALRYWGRGLPLKFSGPGSGRAEPSAEKINLDGRKGERCNSIAASGRGSAAGEKGTSEFQHLERKKWEESEVGFDSKPSVSSSK